MTDAIQEIADLYNDIGRIENYHCDVYIRREINGPIDEMRATIETTNYDGTWNIEFTGIVPKFIVLLMNQPTSTVTIGIDNHFLKVFINDSNMVERINGTNIKLNTMLSPKDELALLKILKYKKENNYIESLSI